MCGAGTRSSLRAYSGGLWGDTPGHSGAGRGKPQHSMYFSCLLNILNLLCTTPRLSLNKTLPRLQVTLQIPRLLPKTSETFAPISPIVTLLLILSSLLLLFLSLITTTITRPSRLCPPHQWPGYRVCVLLLSSGCGVGGGVTGTFWKSFISIKYSCFNTLCNFFSSGILNT